MMRLAACFGIPVDLIEPCGFALSDRHLRRAGMDYLEGLDLVRHVSWDAFRTQPGGRLVLLTTQGDCRFDAFAFAPDDRILVGRESAGVPDSVHAAADIRLRIPIRAEARSLNVAQAAAIAAAEALRQTGGLP